LKTLFIVESPNKVKTIEKYLGSDYKVSASVGHICDLKKTELSIDIENNFKETYEVIKDEKNPRNDKRQIVAKLQALAKEVDMVVLATDPDREGEAISWHLSSVLKKYNKNIKRVTFNEITKTAIAEALKNLRDIDQHLVDAQRARRILDRIVGFQVSGLLQNKMDSNLSAGRVQSAVLRLIKDRDDEIKNFIPKEYWNIFAKLHKQNDDNIFKMKLMKKDEQKIEINNRQEYETVITDLKDAEYKVHKIEQKPEIRKPKPPLKTVTLQKQSYSTFKYDSEKTMKIAQALFEGIDIRGERGGIITYMRSDSVAVSKDFQVLALDYIKKTYGDQYAPEKPQIYKDKDDSQAAHECIRPTNLEYEPESIKEFLTKEQYDVYSLIYHKFISSQMANAIFDTVTVTVKAKNYTFSEKGATINFDGFLKNNKIKSDDEDKEKEKDKEKIFPNLQENEILVLEKLEEEQKFTVPPSYFNEGSLIEELDRLGIGRPSTYSAIIKTIKARLYIITQQEKGQKNEYIMITDLGKSVVIDLINYFSNLFNLDYTKQMEEFLDDVEHNKRNHISVLSDFYKDFKRELDNAYINMPSSKEVKYHTKTCVKCQSKLIIKKGKFGEYAQCESYPTCDYRANLSTVDVVESNIICPICNDHKLVIRTNSKKQNFYSCSSGTCKALPYYEDKDVQKEPCDVCGNKIILTSYEGNKYYRCLGYYICDCKKTKPFIDPKAEKCPNCAKPLIKRKGKNGEFYGCSGYPDCKYIKPDGKSTSNGKPKPTGKPSKEICEKCGSAMVIKENKSDKTKKFLACSGYPKCTNIKSYNKK
jgi:DNA topoisomerase-1